MLSVFSLLPKPKRKKIEEEPEREREREEHSKGGRVKKKREKTAATF